MRRGLRPLPSLRNARRRGVTRAEASRSGTVVFSAPTEGASGRFTIRKRTTSRTVQVRTNQKGIAVAPPFAADAKAGGYIVAATITGTSKRAALALINQPR
jgi:hypothetical protein